ncbi:male-specific lethal 3 homolog [Tribolium castaneum]|uniref:Protein male-specific lethal-3 n=1 Tax=Tribolium castaneum TaxID=7070 RepID=D6X510_TRICA|nr:PREDICTED: male-specific lethal 3 homolog [Tribolium castaneum]EEZ97213.1 Male-specific lethal 3 homolog-like Protein [Tribolium castaneum]|eukprot:XP_015839666.1 PREDICTED: male-specific lethal 3 homolog [Tribolium castaneum]
MVSTRGIKLKFCENERVLCYEPDPTKAKVLYDSKVLDVVVAKDQRGRKTVEYLIHFQGWNSSWDRYVSEEYVLKDTPENRQLQKDLAEKSQLQLGAYLYRRDRKKSRKTSTTAPSSDDCSSGSPTRMDTDDGQGVTSSSEDDSSIEEETVPIELTPELRACLEQDYCLINTKNKLVKLPAEPNVVTILENYWRHYANGQISDLNEKTSQRHRYPFNNTQRRRPEDVQRNLNICSEVLDGIRLYFDYTVNDLLLYKCEQGQIETKQAVYTSIHLDKEVSSSKNEVSYMDYITYPNNHDDYQNGNRQAMQRKRSLRSNKSTDAVSNGNSQDSAKAKASSSVDNNDSCGSRPLSLRLLPEHVYNQQPPPPCLVYGAIHLTRLFVKLPELLNAATIDEKKWTTLLQHMDTFIDYLNEHREWFGEKFYIDRQ